MRNKLSKENIAKFLLTISKRKNFKPALAMSLVGVIFGMVMWSSSKSVDHQENNTEDNYFLSKDVEIKKRKAKLASSPIVTHANKTVVDVLKESAFQAKAKALEMRLSAPLMLVNSILNNQEIPVAQKHISEEGNANKRFMKKVSSQSLKPVEACNIGDLSTVIAQGGLIHAILEPATNSDLPGALRAIVSEPVYSEDGSQELIPRGSRLIGEYKSGMQQGQSRVFIVWSRLITPQGVSLQLGSEGVDDLGVAGLGADKINRHFWQRFGTASLLSLIGMGSAGMSGDAENIISSYRSAVASSFSQSASQSLQQDSSQAPTLETFQGKSIMVFIARDLYFRSAMQDIKKSLYVF